MGASFGTGQPLFVRCSPCRRRGKEFGWKLVRTGRTRPKNDGRASHRSMNVEHEYRCLGCGHVGWSRHVDIARKPLEANDVLHRRNTGSFGFGQTALCGAKNAKMTTNPKYVDCPACKRQIEAMRIEAQKRAVR